MFHGSHRGIIKFGDRPRRGRVTEEQPITWEATIAGHRVMQEKGNNIPHGIVPLEMLFKSNNMALKPAE